MSANTTATTAAPTDTAVARHLNLAIGARGQRVRELQVLLNQRLASQGFLPIAVDGDFGPQTKTAVENYQRCFALLVDGIVGQQTWTSLQRNFFSDIDPHWAGDYITALYHMGLVVGTRTGSYNPEQPMLRSHFAQLIVAAFNPVLRVVRPPISFPDVPPADAQRISRAYETGLMSGFADGTFRPSEAIRRQDVLVVLYNATERLLNSNGNPDPIGLLRRFYDDAREVSDYAVRAASEMTAYSIVVSHPRRRWLRPQDFATRADVAAILTRAIVISVSANRPGVVQLGYRVPSHPIASPFVVNA